MSKRVWDIEFTEEFRSWWDTLDEDTQVDVAKKIEVLRVGGPTTGRPTVAEVDGSSIKNLKEIRIGKALRVLFVFDPRQVAILLHGGDKSVGSKKWHAWYVPAITRAEALYTEHLAELKTEGLL